MANPVIKHASLTNAAPNPAVLVDGPKWDATHTVTGLENVDNTSDLSKPISTATQAALNARVSTINGQAGALVSYFAPQGRVTLASGVPVMGTSQAGCTTVYYTPYAGNIVPIYDGTNMVPTATAEISQATTDTTKSPAAVAASKIYDLFVWNDSGTIRCTRGPAWTNSTTRGYTFTMVNGILLNTSAITNGPGASRGTWVGTIASNASSTIDYVLGAAGVAAVLNVWNAYNQADISTTVTDNGASYTYTTGTIRQARASAINQVSWVNGSAENSFLAINTTAGNGVATGALVNVGLGLDTTSAFTVNLFQVTYNNISMGIAVPLISTPAIGTHVLAALEKGDGTNANVYDVASNNTLSFRMRM